MLASFQDDSCFLYFSCLAESRVPLKVVRIGNPDNIHEDILSYSLFELIKSNANRSGNIVAFVLEYFEMVLYHFVSCLVVAFYIYL